MYIVIFQVKEYSLKTLLVIWRDRKWPLCPWVEAWLYISRYLYRTSYLWSFLFLHLLSMREFCALLWKTTQKVWLNETMKMENTAAPTVCVCIYRRIIQIVHGKMEWNGKLILIQKKLKLMWARSLQKVPRE